MFVVCAGTVDVVLEPDRRRVATIEAGGYFGEMSLLTGEPRTATVLAVGDTTVLELDADGVPTTRRGGSARDRAGRRWPRSRGASSSTRRATSARIAATGEAPATFLGRMKRFLGMD